MKGRQIVFFVLTLAAACYEAQSSNEILNILDTANDLTLQEVNALRPLFNELQKQYDAIRTALANQDANNIVSWQKEAIPESAVDEHYNDLMENLLKRSQVEELNSSKYDTKLPTLAELMGDAPIHTADMSAEQMAELEDLQQIMQEALDEAQTGLDELVSRALLIESEMLKLNKPKIVMYIYNALSVLFRYSSQLRRAAYCVYSHVPQLNESLQNLNAGIECYTYTKQLAASIEHEIVHTIVTIKKDVLDLAKVYKKIAAKHTIVGKIVTAILNIFKIMRDVRETLAVTTKAIDKLENQLPSAAIKSAVCGVDFAKTLPYMVETAFNVTTCITYVEPFPEPYEWQKPESERNFVLDDSK